MVDGAVRGRAEGGGALPGGQRGGRGDDQQEPEWRVWGCCYSYCCRADFGAGNTETETSASQAEDEDGESGGLLEACLCGRA